MTYVDLNPVHAAMAQTLETSGYTSIQARINKKDTKLLGFGDDDISNYLSEFIVLVDYIVPDR